MNDTSYPVTDRSRVRLFGGRGSNEKQAIHEIIDAALYGVVSYQIDDQPFATPTMVWRHGDYIYWHGSAGSRMLKHVSQGVNVCVNFTLLDGYVLSRLASAHTLNYRSVMVFGRPEGVAAPKARREQLEYFLSRYFPGRWHEVKQPSEAELHSIIMVRMRIEEGSAKRRSGPPADGLAIFGGEALYKQQCWAGEIPLATVALPGRPAKRLHESVATPDYVKDFAQRAGYRTPAEVNAHDGRYPVTVSETEMVGHDIKRFRLAIEGGLALPPIPAGSHVRIGTVLNDRTREARQYTVVEAAPDGRWCDIAVLREDEGRGGSRYLHDEVEVGAALEIEVPVNEFPLDPATRHAILIAGGIGVTPIVAMARALQQAGTSFEVHYSARGLGGAAFVDTLREICGDALHLYDTSAGEGARMRLLEVLAGRDAGTHSYTCGPAALIDAVVEAASAVGFPPACVHHELFKAPAPLSSDKPVTVLFARSKRELRVEPGTSILDAALSIGIPVPHSCKRGECGLCATKLLGDGKVSYRDRFLTDAQRSEEGLACVCVCWVEGETLAVDL
ncbi:pyridoxamine 5'-phosphate oxidase family protein [Cupriavidus sp. amp6]|uniref:pyridoxamine 5'-phosphate oxidase family protein n=1 Tax=Cupriavidus sp. amp6 TaxID=388051 RepID=UPI0003F81A15|nr:pyridoxamine 5'-phosphate oxidase family protein [Cupriavidus sp. amp6]